MNILHVAPCYVDLRAETGGVANVVRQLARQQVKLGHKVTVLCTTTELAHTVAAESDTVVDGVRQIVCHQRSNPAFGPTGVLAKGLSKALKDVLGDSTAAHVHTCFSAFTEEAMRELARLHIPFVFSPHGKLSDGMLSKRRLFKMAWWALSSRNAVSKASVLGLVSATEAPSLGRMGIAAPVRVIPNGFQAPITAVEGDVGKYILFLGYLDPRKRPGFLLRAYAQSGSRRTHRLKLVGPDAYGMGDELVRLARHLGVSDTTDFHGPAYGEAKWKILRGAACLCLPSLAEGQPVVLCEALGAGIPSVYSSACNFPEIHAQGAGAMLSDGASPSEWAKVLDQLLENEGLRQSMCENASRISGQYEWPAIAARWAGAYKDMLGSAK